MGQFCDVALGKINGNGNKKNEWTMLRQRGEEKGVQKMIDGYGKRKYFVTGGKRKKNWIDDDLYQF